MTLLVVLTSIATPAL